MKAYILQIVICLCVFRVVVAERSQKCAAKHLLLICHFGSSK